MNSFREQRSFRKERWQGVAEQRILNQEGFQPKAGGEKLCLLWGEEEMGLTGSTRGLR